jgi:hypothetical protein
MIQFAQAEACATVARLVKHDISRWALTGGFAIEMYMGEGVVRPLNDIDFMVSSFDCIPESLGQEFVLRHVHPSDPPGKTLLQCVDPETRVRVDVFRAYGSEMERSEAHENFRIVSLQDLTARAARLSWDLAENVPLAPKYARDFLGLLKLVQPEELESVWQDHRKPHMPASFVEVAATLIRLVEARTDLLKSIVYSTDVNAVCARCHDTAALRLAPPAKVLSLLGYC